MSRAEIPQVPTVGAGATFNGLLSFRGAARVDGEVSGEVVAAGMLHISERAVVRARIEVDELIVDGRLEGDAVARQRIELGPSARVVGTLRAPRLLLADGCQVQGRCETVPVRTESPFHDLS